jgi:hypothetical protein
MSARRDVKIAYNMRRDKSETKLIKNIYRYSITTKKLFFF